MKPDDRTNTVNPVPGASLIQVTHVHNQPPNREAIRRARRALHEARENVHALQSIASKQRAQLAENADEIARLSVEANKAEGLARALDRAITQRDEARRDRDVARHARQAIEKAITQITEDIGCIGPEDVPLAHPLRRHIREASDLVGK